MNQDYFKSWSIMTNEVQKPLQAILELQVNTVKNLRYLRADELTHLRTPEEFMSTNFSLALENSQRVVELMQKSLQIFEHSFLFLSQGLKQNWGQSFKPAQTVYEPQRETEEAKQATPNKKTTAKKKTTQLASAKAQVKTPKTAAKTAIKLKAKPAVQQAKLSAEKAAAKKKNQSEKSKTKNAAKSATQQKKKLVESKSLAGKKLTSLGKRDKDKKKTATPKKSLLAKNITKPIQKSRSQDKLDRSLQRSSSPLIDQNMNFADEKVSEPKINIPSSRTTAFDGKIGGDSMV